MLKLATLMAFVLWSGSWLFGQTPPAGSLSGKLTDATGAAVAHATVTIINAATNQARTATTGPDGGYQFTQLSPGSYRVKFEAAGFQPLEIAATAVGATPTTVDGRLGLGAATPSLSDLGFNPDLTKGSIQDQARLDRRSHMLKIHQRLGLITLAPMVTTLFLSNGAAGHNSSSSGRNLHAALGGVTAGMYLTTASFAIFAPKIPGTQTRGSIRIHKALAFIHGPGMILTPILGAMALQQRNRGEKVHGIAGAHGAVAGITAAAYGAAMLSVMIKF